MALKQTTKQRVKELQKVTTEVSKEINKEINKQLPKKPTKKSTKQEPTKQEIKQEPTKQEIKQEPTKQEIKQVSTKQVSNNHQATIKKCDKMRISDALDKIKEILSNKIHIIETTKNKGIVGQYIEKSIGISLNSDCLDLIDGEIKAFPLKKNKTSDSLVPKETIAITMTDRELLKTEKFNDTKLCMKIQNIIYVPYLRNSKKVLIFDPILIKLSNNKNIYDNIKKDYELIQNTLIKENQIKSKIGDYLQSRTKGAKDKKTRAYYFKTKYIREYIIPHINYNQYNKNLINNVLE